MKRFKFERKNNNKKSYNDMLDYFEDIIAKDKDLTDRAAEVNKKIYSQLKRKIDNNPKAAENFLPDIFDLLRTTPRYSVCAIFYEGKSYEIRIDTLLYSLDIVE